MMNEEVLKNKIVFTSLPKHAYRSFFKPLMDWLIALIAILLLSPFMIIIVLAIKLDSRGPVFFVQDRLGLDNKTFRIVKFRTMRDKNERYISDEQRITRIGRVLRLFRIDELPQLFNIFKGDMSFIGPRPLLKSYLNYYTAEEKRRHDVRPGLSGLSQVSNLNYPKWEEQFEYDVYYVDHLCLSLDFKIFVQTIVKILKPNHMAKTGIAGGRMSFDIYRRSQSKQEIK